MNEAVYSQVNNNIDVLQRVLVNLDKDTLAEWGKKALELISDYPLYASGTCNISYAQAIVIAMVVFGDFLDYAEFGKEES